MQHQLAKFVEKFPTKQFGKGEMIVYQEETSPCLYAIKTGFVKAYDINNDGSEQLVWFGSTPDIFPIVFFNELAIRPTNFFYSAFSDTEVYCVDSTQFSEFLHSDSNGLFDFYRLTAQRYIDMMKRLGAVEKPKAADKIIFTLDYLASRYHGSTKNNEVEVLLPLTHQDIANLVGLTRETTAVELKRLKDKGYIYYDKWHFRINRLKLQELL